MEDDNLNNGIDNLLNMFKKLMEDQDIDSIPGIDEEQKERLKMFLDDFDELKDEMKVEIYKLDPNTRQLMASFVGQLNNLSNNPQFTTNQPTTPVEPPVNQEKQLTEIPGTTENLKAQLKSIDDQLRQPNLSDEEINRLLDERMVVAEELGL